MRCHYLFYFLVPFLSIAYEIKLLTQYNNYYLLRQGKAVSSSSLQCLSGESCSTYTNRAPFDYYGGNSCVSENDCADKCLSDDTCNGYSIVNMYDANLPFPLDTSGTQYSGNICYSDQECREKCLADDSCKGYSKWQYGMYAPLSVYTGTCPQNYGEFCTEYGPDSGHTPQAAFPTCGGSSNGLSDFIANSPRVPESYCKQGSLKLYNPPSCVNYETLADPDSMTRMTEDRLMTPGTRYSPSVPLVVYNRLYGCYLDYNGGLAWSNPDATWEDYYRDSLSYDVGYYDSCEGYSYCGGEIYKRSWHSYRIFYAYRYGAEMTVLNAVNQMEVGHYKKDYNKLVFQYGSTLTNIVPSATILTNKAKEQVDTVDTICKFPTQAEFQQFTEAQFGFTPEVLNVNTYPFGAILIFDENKAVYNEGNVAFSSNVDCSNEYLCVCQTGKEGISIYQYGGEKADSYTLNDYNQRVQFSYHKYATQNSYVAHQYGTCTFGGNAYEYYTQEECDLNSGFFSINDNRHDLKRHLTSITRSDIAENDEKTIDEIKHSNILLPLLGSSNTNQKIYFRSSKKLYNGFESHTSKNKAIQDCTQKCRTNDECTYVTVTPENSCELYRKCEGVVSNSNDHFSFKKIGWSVQSETTAGDVNATEFYQVFAEQFLCSNYALGEDLHKSLFSLKSADNLFVGSTFSFFHDNIDIWPSQTYIYSHDEYWRGTLAADRRYLKYNNVDDVYSAYYTNEEGGVGAKYAFEKQTLTCDYHLTKQECKDYASFNSLAQGDMELEGKENFYASIKDDCLRTEGVDATRCMEYKNLLQLQGDIVETVNHPSGCSIMIDPTGALASIVIYNSNPTDETRIGDTSQDGFVFHRVCFGNENRLHPQRCFISNGLVQYNGDNAFTTCSSSKKCLCSFSIPILNVEGGVKEAINEENCASLCLEKENCTYIQHHNNLCYGLTTCQVKNTYNFEVDQNWTTCNDYQQQATATVTSGEMTNEFLSTCASACHNNYQSDFIMVKKGSITNFDVSGSNTGKSESIFIGHANSILDCHYLSKTQNIYYDRDTRECFSNGNLNFNHAWSDSVTCHCMSDQCHFASEQEPYSVTEWKQVMKKVLVDDLTQNTKVNKITTRQNYFSLFPFYGKWNCDADVISGVTEEECATTATNKNLVIFSYNAISQICLLYNHFVDNAKDVVIANLEHAEWCYKDGILQGIDGMDMEYGTCSVDVTTFYDSTVRSCDVEHKVLVNENECLDWHSTLNYRFVYAGKVKEFYNLAEAVDECLVDRHCNFVVQNSYHSTFLYELHTYKREIHTTQNIPQTWTAVDSCYGKQQCLTDTLQPFVYGYPDSNVTMTECSAKYGNIAVEDYETLPYGCIHDIAYDYYFFNTNNNSVECSENYACVRRQAHNYAIVGNKEVCSKIYNSYDCISSNTTISFLTLPTYMAFSCRNGNTQRGTIVYDLTLLECQDLCAQQPDCIGINYGGITNMGISTTICRYDTGTVDSETGSGGLGSGLNVGLPSTNIPEVTCTYDRNASTYNQLVPRNKCTTGTFTPHSNVNYDKFKTFMIGNVGYNTGGTECVQCPAGQETVSNTVYRCDANTKKHFTAVQGESNVQNDGLLIVQTVTTTLKSCKDACDRISSCATLNFESVGDNFDVGRCFLMTNVQQQEDTENLSFLSCQKEIAFKTCQPCEVGKFKTGSSTQPMCQSCTVGKFQDEKGQASCKVCKEETYQDLLGKTNCKTDLSYFYENIAGKTISVQSEVNNIGNFKGLVFLGEVDNFNVCVQIGGNAGYTLGYFDESLCYGTLYGKTEDEVTDIIAANNFLTTKSDGSEIVFRIKTVDRMCGFALKKDSSGPYQNNILRNLPTEKQGASTKCDACLQFQIENFDGGCSSCEPGKHYTSIAGGVCFDCKQGYARLGAINALRKNITGTGVDTILVEPLEVLHPGIVPASYPSFEEGIEYFKQFDIDIPNSDQGFDFNCFICPPGRYQPMGQAVECVACQEGKYNRNWGSTVDCLDCPAGQFINNNVKNNYFAMDGTTEVTDGGHFHRVKLIGETECQQCLPGFYQGVIGQTQCDKCEVGRFQSNSGANVCNACGNGQYNDEEAQTICKDCLAGQYTNESEQTECTPCEVGKYQLNDKQSSCDICVGGRYADAEGYNTECKTCETGKYSADNQDAPYYEECTLCETGKFQDITESTSCKLCETGKYLDQEGSKTASACISCPSGRYNEIEGKSSLNDCILCEAGRYAKATDTGSRNQDAACKVCDNGRYSATVGFVDSNEVECTACPAGKFLDNLNYPTGSRHDNIDDCQNCFIGQYQDLTGQASCKSCSVGGTGFGLGMNTEGDGTGLSSEDACAKCAAGGFNNYNIVDDQPSDIISCPVVSPDGKTCTVQHEAQECTHGGAAYCCLNGRWTTGTCFSIMGDDYKFCKPCPRGSYQDETGQKHCKQCGYNMGGNNLARWYQDQRGKKSCKNSCNQPHPYGKVPRGCREPNGKACEYLEDCDANKCAGTTASSGLQNCQDYVFIRGLEAEEVRCLVCGTNNWWIESRPLSSADDPLGDLAPSLAPTPGYWMGGGMIIAGA